VCFSALLFALCLSLVCVLSFGCCVVGAGRCCWAGIEWWWRAGGVGEASLFCSSGRHLAAAASATPPNSGRPDRPSVAQQSKLRKRTLQKATHPRAPPLGRERGGGPTQGDERARARETHTTNCLGAGDLFPPSSPRPVSTHHLEAHPAHGGSRWRPLGRSAPSAAAPAAAAAAAAAAGAGDPTAAPAAAAAAAASDAC
jgi:hypothetical protein